MKRLKIGLLTALLSLSFSAFSVDGYQKAKFGMSEKEVKSLYKCAWEKDDDGLYCANFKLGNLKTEAWFYFLDDKFERAAFLIPDDNVEGVVQALKNKYKLSTPFPNEAKNPQPNQMYDAGFDNDTVIFRVGYENDMTEYSVLIYTSPEFDAKERHRQIKNVSDGL